MATRKNLNSEKKNMLESYMEFYMSTPSGRDHRMRQPATIVGRRSALCRVVKKYCNHKGVNVTLEDMVGFSDDEQGVIVEAIRTQITSRPGAGSKNGEESAYRDFYKWATGRNVPSQFTDGMKKLYDDIKVEQESVDEHLARVTPSLVRSLLEKHRGEIPDHDQDTIAMLTLLEDAFRDPSVPWFRPNVWAMLWIGAESDITSTYDPSTGDLNIRGDKLTKSGLDSRTVQEADKLFPNLFGTCDDECEPHKLFASNHTQQLTATLASLLRKLHVNEEAGIERDITFTDIRHVKSAWALQSLTSDELTKYATSQGHAVDTLRSQYANTVLIRTKEGLYIRPGASGERSPSPASVSSNLSRAPSFVGHTRDECMEMTREERVAEIDRAMAAIEEMKPWVLAYKAAHDYFRLLGEVNGALIMEPPVIHGDPVPAPAPTDDPVPVPPPTRLKPSPHHPK